MPYEFACEPSEARPASTHAGLALSCQVHFAASAECHKGGLVAELVWGPHAVLVRGPRMDILLCESRVMVVGPVLIGEARTLRLVSLMLRSGWSDGARRCRGGVPVPPPGARFVLKSGPRMLLLHRGDMVGAH